MSIELLHKPRSVSEEVAISSRDDFAIHFSAQSRMSQLAPLFRAVPLRTRLSFQTILMSYARNILSRLVDMTADQDQGIGLAYTGQSVGLSVRFVNLALH